MKNSHADGGAGGSCPLVVTEQFFDLLCIGFKDMNCAEQYEPRFYQVFILHSVHLTEKRRVVVVLVYSAASSACSLRNRVLSKRVVV